MERSLLASHSEGATGQKKIMYSVSQITGHFSEEEERMAWHLIIQVRSLVLLDDQTKKGKGQEDARSKHKVQPTSSHLQKLASIVQGRMCKHTFGIWKTRKKPMARKLNQTVSQVPAIEQ